MLRTEYFVTTLCTYDVLDWLVLMLYMYMLVYARVIVSLSIYVGIILHYTAARANDNGAPALVTDLIVAIIGTTTVVDLTGIGIVAVLLLLTPMFECGRNGRSGSRMLIAV